MDTQLIGGLKRIDPALMNALSRLTAGLSCGLCRAWHGAPHWCSMAGLSLHILLAHAMFKKNIWIRCQRLKTRRFAYKKTDFRLSLGNPKIWPLGPTLCMAATWVKVKAGAKWNPSSRQSTHLCTLPHLSSPDRGWSVPRSLPVRRYRRPSYT